MPDVGDRVRFHSRKVGEAPREGVVTGVTGQLLSIRWSTGEESMMVPGPGSLAIVGKEAAPSRTKPSGPKKAVKSASKPRNTVKKSPR